MDVLSELEIADFCRVHPQWTYAERALRGMFVAADFPQAITWVNAIAAIAEEMDHHPDIDIRWRTLHLALNTHSAGGVTGLDTALAVRIDQVVGVSP